MVAKAKKTVVKKNQVAALSDCATAPLALHYRVVYDFGSRAPKAYVSETVLNGLEYGVIRGRDLDYTYEKQEAGIELAKWNIRTAMQHISLLCERGKAPDWLAVNCPVSFLLSGKLADYILRRGRYCSFAQYKRLGILFSQELLYADTACVKTALARLKALGVTILLSDFGSPDCYVTRVDELPIDVLLLDAAFAPQNDTAKYEAVGAFLRYLRSMHFEVVATCVQNDEQLDRFLRQDCGGFTCDDAYCGGVRDRGEVLIEALLEEEEEDDA